MDLGLRLITLLVLVVAAFAIAGILPRSGRRPRGLTLPAGLTVVTGPACRWCDRLLDALNTGAADLRVSVLDIDKAAGAGLAVRSVPTAVVVDETGDVLFRRSGAAAIEDLDRLIGLARAVQAAV